MSRTWQALVAVALLSPFVAMAYSLGEAKPPATTDGAGDKPRPRIEIVVNDLEPEKRRPARIVYVNGTPSTDDRRAQRDDCMQHTGSRLIRRDKSEQRCANSGPGQVFVPIR
ncbi:MULTISPECIES: hypothetical protein [unclassified Pseudoxanthomonas]|uniref:hypothetical protein n=1 Tax=unclassified Pseudoxanthomonas TaxID=2645906 RepID=UPI0008ECA992|nr:MULTISPECIES: hypothetical protein [unclassified Pseudoxanthomonas]PPJ42073.1 hypothetical protein C0063_01840 [Pseudoxanthomonas sp. KAs_5_3]SFV28654.1 hypothetical protein SAMN05428990_1066 [Pseudoxanthomonas sp. YR558]